MAVRTNRAVIFDLDGTLTQSEEGIFNCVRHAARAVGAPVPDDTALREYIGPPLAYSFRAFMGLDDETAERAIAAFRERYHRVGLFENRVYPGIRRLLRTLKARGDYVGVATGKHGDATRRILDHFGLSPFIDSVCCAADGRSEKADIIHGALPESFSEAWMVGDRRFDMEGGRAAGIHTIGALYGYGTAEELEASGAEVLVESVQALIDFLCPGQEPPRGAFLSMEGLDGSGKSTQIALLTDALDRWGFEVVHSREPGGTRVGDMLRAIILDPDNPEITAETEALLYAASRAQHVRELIRPTVAAGRVLLCDRFVDSSVAYQGGGRELGVQHILDLNAAAVDGTLPLATVYLDINHEAALKRRHAATAPDRMEAESDAFFARVEKAYRELIRRDPERFIVVDATQPPEKLGEEVARRVLERLMADERP